MSTTGAAARISNPAPAVMGSVMTTAVPDVTDTLPADTIGGLIVTVPVLAMSILPVEVIVPVPLVVRPAVASMPTVVPASSGALIVMVDPLIDTGPPVETGSASNTDPGAVALIWIGPPAVSEP